MFWLPAGDPLPPLFHSCRELFLLKRVFYHYAENGICSHTLLQ